jgi:hypothetical protein
VLGEAATNCGPYLVLFCSTALQVPGAGAGGIPGSCRMCSPAASPMEGTSPLLRWPRRNAVPDGHPRLYAVAQAGFPAVGQRVSAGAARERLAGLQWETSSSGVVLASFLVLHVGVCAGDDLCGVLLLCVASQGGFSQRCR